MTEVNDLKLVKKTTIIESLIINNMSLQQVTVSITNNAPENGTFLTPFWVGFHNGFDTYDRGRPASPGLESLAEDGDTALITEEFAFSGQGQIDGTLGDGPIAPGETVHLTFNIDPTQGDANFFNYASMVLPSNDTFIANGNEFAYQVFDENGNFIPLDFNVTGSEALDAGTEINDEIPANTAFFGQQTPNTGEDQNEGVQLAEGFLPPGSGGILDDPMFANADYTVEGFEFANIQVTSEPSARLTSVLDGEQEVDPGDPDAAGTSQLILNEYGDALSYELTVSGLDFGAFIGDGTPQTKDTSDDVTRLHIHTGDRGENGGVAFGILDLVDPAADGQDSDDLKITVNDDGSTTLTGIWEETDPALISLSEFTEEIQNAAPGEDIGLYWNVHTEEFPGGAIRGQLQGDLLLPTTEIVGTAHPDSLTGTDADEVIRGLEGNDTLSGQGGNDWLFGGAGHDILTGGEGSDRFVLAAGYGTDTITDFQDGIDYLVLDGGLTFGQLSITYNEANQSTQIGLSESGEILAELNNISADLITEADFLV